VKYDEIHNDKILEEWEHMRCWAGKSHLLRIVGNLHCAECVLNDIEPSSQNISADTFQRGIDIFDCLSAHADKAYSLDVEANVKLANARYLLKKLKEVESITVRDLFQKCKRKRGFKSVDEMKESLELLAKHRYLKIVSECTGKSGRPSEVIKMAKF
jgi:hypothetical protein